MNKDEQNGITMKHRAFLIPFLGLTHFLSSCTFQKLTAKWVEQPIDGPWSAPGIHARQFERSYFFGIMDAGVTTDMDWATSTGSRRDASKIPASIDRYLKKHGYFDQWPESNSSIGDGVLRVAPFTFHIVAIDPLVVIMVPHDFGNPKGNRSTYEIVGSQPKQAFGSLYMLNYIEYGTGFPYSTNVIWFSPDLGLAPTAPTRLGDSRLEITNKHIKLVMMKEGDLWMTHRVKP